MMIEQRTCIGDKIIQIKCIESDSIPCDLTVTPVKIDDKYYFDMWWLPEPIRCNKHDIVEFKYTKQSTMKQFKGWAFRYNSGGWDTELFTVKRAKWLATSGIMTKSMDTWVAVYE